VGARDEMFDPARPHAEGAPAEGKKNKKWTAGVAQVQPQSKQAQHLTSSSHQRQQQRRVNQVEIA